MNLRRPLLGVIAFGVLACGCAEPAPSDRVRASGYAEATEIRLAPEVGGRVLELTRDEGDRVEPGEVVARLDTADTDLAIRRTRADRAQADAQLRLLLAGTRPEEVRQAEAQVQAAEAEIAAARSELGGAETDLERFERLLEANSGSRKQRDDAATRRGVAQARLTAAEEAVRAARAVLARLRAGARPEEVAAARARLAGVEAQLATLEKARADATVRAPASGVVTERIVEVGELVAPGATMLVITDLDHAWANVYVDEPVVPRIKLGQPATILTDAGGPGLRGTITFISPKAEFTPRNVQTAEERAKLVYRVKVSVDNRDGVLKQGMPVEAELVFGSPQS
jgi:HlyD family secretion protein